MNRNTFTRALFGLILALIVFGFASAPSATPAHADDWAEPRGGIWIDSGWQGAAPNGWFNYSTIKCETNCGGLNFLHNIEGLLYWTLRATHPVNTHILEAWQGDGYIWKFKPTTVSSPGPGSFTTTWPEPIEQETDDWEFAVLEEGWEGTLWDCNIEEDDCESDPRTNTLSEWEYVGPVAGCAAAYQKESNQQEDDIYHNCDIISLASQHNRWAWAIILSNSSS